MGKKVNNKNGKSNSVIVLIVIVLIVLITWGIINSMNKKRSEPMIADDSYDEMEYGNAIEEYSVNDGTCNLEIEGEQNSIRRGQTNEYTIMASDINAGEGIVMIEALLEYDSNSIECEVTAEENGEWSLTGMAEDYVTFVRRDLQPSSSDQMIGKIKVKAKNNSTSGQQTIKIKNIMVTMDSDKYFYLDDQELNVKVE